MIADRVAVDAIAALGHDEAMDLTAVEFARLLDLLESLAAEDWSRPTDCPGWDVTAVIGHLLGMLELQADPAERDRQLAAAGTVAAEQGGLRLDALTALQVREHAHLTPGALTEALRQAVPRGIAARRALPEQARDLPYDPAIPGEAPWTLGYLYDTIHTRDPWMHRIDVCRAVGRDPVLSSDHDGRLVADVVRDWSQRHGQGFSLTLEGPAGGAFTSGLGGPLLESDAIEFCRTLSGRAEGAGLLSTRVAF